MEKSMYIPEKTYDEIKLMLKIYYKLDKLIDKRINNMRNIYINSMAVTNQSYLQAFQKDNNTLENIIVKLDDDWLVRKYRAYKSIINTYINRLSGREDKLDYYLLKYKYLDRMSDDFILEKTNLDIKELKQRYSKMKRDIYQIGLERGLYKEVS